jgi:divalent metal cation (Fe/Co/Zn/Cd) transporter
VVFEQHVPPVGVLPAKFLFYLFPFTFVLLLFYHLCFGQQLFVILIGLFLIYVIYKICFSCVNHSIMDFKNKKLKNYYENLKNVENILNLGKVKTAFNWKQRLCFIYIGH